MWSELVIAILLLFVLILTFLLTNFAFHKDVPVDGVINVKLDDLQTGDIMVVDYQNIHNFLITSLFSENTMHMAIVIREGDDIKILDYIHPHGLVKRSVSNWLISTRHSIKIINKLECNELYREKLTAKLNQLFYFYEKKLLDGPSGFTLDWVRFWWPSQNYVPPREMKKLVCIEVMMYFLMEAGVIKKEKSIESYLPRHFEKMEEITLEPGYKFKEKYLLNTIIF